MTTQYTPILKIALPVTGELSGTWGDVVNDNITSMFEQAIAGLATISTWSANSHTLTTANGTTSESRCAMLVAADGAGLAAAGEIICPAASKLYVLKNGSSYALTLKTAGGTGVAVAAGETAFLFCDGTNVNACVTTIVDGRVTGNLTVDGNATVNGNTTLGNATSDTITATARFASDLVPSTDNARDLGSSANSWRSLWIDGTATMALVAISGGTIDGVSIGASTAATIINVDNLRLDGNTISSTDTNGNIVIAPNGTGDVQLDADTVRVGDSGAAATLTSNGAGALTVTTGGAANLVLSTNSGTDSGTITIANGANGNISIVPNGTGDVQLDADTVRIGDANTDVTLTSNGTGNLNLSTNGGTNSGTIQIAQGANASISLTPNGTGTTVIKNPSISGTTTFNDGNANQVIYLNASKQATTSANLTFDGTTLTANALTTTSTVTINGGTANGVAYLNGSKVLTTGTVLVFDGAQLFINGITAGRGASSVGSNTAFGVNALSANTTGNQNTAMGLSALLVNTTGSGNTSIGRESLVYNTTGSNNTALGVNALWTNVSGSQSVAVGVNALFYNTVSNNTAVGYEAGGSITTGLVTAVGAFAAATATTATGITAIGNGALRYTTTGSLNTAVGSGDASNFPPLFFNTTGAGNVAVGVQTMYTNTTGSNNTAVGNFAMQANTTADNNTAVGTSALFSNTTGTLNTALGMYALRLNVAGTRNTAVGYNALQSYAASGQADNVAVGLNAMNTVTAGTANTAVGNYALGSNATSTGSANSVVGTYALQTLTSGSSNTAMGFQAGYSLTTGSRNVLIGRNSAFGMSSGSENTVIGPSNGSDTGVGAALTSGSTNTLIGINAALNLTSGSYNTIVGGYTLPSATTSNAVALADGSGNARFLYLNSTSAQARYASNETMLSYVSANQGGVLRHRNIPVLGNPNGGTYKGYLILAKAYDGVVGQALSNVLGRFIFVRGGTGSGNRSSIFDVNCATAYSVTTVGISGLDQGDYAQRIVTCTYDSEQWIALETSQTGGSPDGGVFFEGTFQDAGMVYVDATYVSLISEFNSSVGLNVTNFGSTLNLNSGQITFPATQNASSNANTLDDYEEGTWTPTLRGSGTAGNFNESVRVGSYTKVGNMVTLYCAITCGAITGSPTGNLQITGLPFSVAAGTSGNGAAQIGGVGQSTVQGVSFSTRASTNVLYVTYIDGSNNAQIIQASSVSGSAIIDFCISYPVA